MFAFVENDTASVLKVTCVDRFTDAPIDLSTALSVKVYYSIEGGATANKTMTPDPDQVTNPGVATYRWLAGELSPAGKMIAEVEIVDALSHTLTSNRDMIFLIRERL